MQKSIHPPPRPPMLQNDILFHHSSMYLPVPPHLLMLVIKIAYFTCQLWVIYTKMTVLFSKFTYVLLQICLLDKVVQFDCRQMHGIHTIPVLPFALVIHVRRPPLTSCSFWHMSPNAMHMGRLLRLKKHGQKTTKTNKRECVANGTFIHAKRTQTYIHIQYNICS